MDCQVWLSHRGVAGHLLSVVMAVLSLGQLLWSPVDVGLTTSDQGHTP